MGKPGLLDMNQHCVAAATKANTFLGCINRYIESKSWKENIPFNSALFILHYIYYWIPLFNKFK